MTTTPDRTTRETRRRHIDRLSTKDTPTASERALLERLRRLKADDPSLVGEDDALRSALGLATTSPARSEEPTMTRPTDDTPTPTQDAHDAATTAPQARQAQEPRPEPPSPREARKLARKVPSDAEVAHRRRVYAKHLPVHPIPQTRVPAPLADLPEFCECAEERAAVLAAEANARTARRAWHKRTETARREHVAAQRAALLDGTPPPAPLAEEPWPFPQHDPHVFLELHAVVEARELALLEEHQARWVQVVQAQADEMRHRISEARAVLDALRAEAHPVESALALLQGDRYVDDRIVPGQPERISPAEAEAHDQARRTYNRRQGDARLQGRR